MDGLGIIGWIVLGGLAGWVASMFAGTNARQGMLGNIIAGVIGGVVGGWVFGLFGGPGVTGFNLWSFVVAVVGALSTGAYVNAAINERVTQSQAEQLQPAATVEQIQPAGTIEIKTYNPQQTINGKELQGN